MFIAVERTNEHEIAYRWRKTFKGTHDYAKQQQPDRRWLQKGEGCVLGAPGPNPSSQIFSNAAAEQGTLPMHKTVRLQFRRLTRGQNPRHRTPPCFTTDLQKNMRFACFGSKFNVAKNAKSRPRPGASEGLFPGCGQEVVQFCFTYRIFRTIRRT